VTSLVRSGPSDGDDIDRLRSRVTRLEAVLTARAADMARAKAGLATFRNRYRQDVGLLHEELDELERAIAEAELGELSKLVDGDADGPAAPAPDTRPEDPPRFTSDGVRSLFREVARTIHPDLGRDDLTRDQRHTLMVEANRAYALGDEERLRSILESWARSPEAVQGTDPEATRVRLVRRIAQIETQLAVYDGDLATLQSSPLWQLKAMVDDAAARDKDLVADMVRRLKRDIMAARNRLDAMRWTP
jgi:hypothetical protein